MSEMKRKLVELVNDYLQKHQENPTRIYIPKLIENEMTAEGEIFHHELADWRKGIRDVLGDTPMFGDYLLIWDADELKVEFVESDIPIIRTKLKKRKQ